MGLFHLLGIRSVMFLAFCFPIDAKKKLSAITRLSRQATPFIGITLGIGLHTFLFRFCNMTDRDFVFIKFKSLS